MNRVRARPVQALLGPRPAVPGPGWAAAATGPRGRRAGRRPARGAALLVAMVLLTVVATLASGMVWQQWRSVQVETAERARAQSLWMVAGGLDYARLILREDQVRSDNPNSQDRSTNLGSPWNTPLQETPLSSIIAADRDNNTSNDAQAFISGSITDVQSRWNLRHLVADGKLVPTQVAVLSRLCELVGLSANVGTRLADQYLAAVLGRGPTAPLRPESVDDLLWLGLDEDSLRRLAPLVTLLPEPTKVNLNTAPREVLAAVIPNIDLGSADRLVQARNRGHFKRLEDATAALGGTLPLPAAQVDVQSMHFEVMGRVRLEDRVMVDRYLVQRRPGPQVRAVMRLRPAAAPETPAR